MSACELVEVLSRDRQVEHAMDLEARDREPCCSANSEPGELGGSTNGMLTSASTVVRPSARMSLEGRRASIAGADALPTVVGMHERLDDRQMGVVEHRKGEVAHSDHLSPCQQASGRCRCGLSSSSKRCGHCLQRPVRRELLAPVRLGVVGELPPLPHLLVVVHIDLCHPHTPHPTELSERQHPVYAGDCSDKSVRG